MNFKIEKKKNKTVVIKPEGRLVGDFQTVEWSDHIDELLEDRYRHFIFNLSGLEYMNSSGLNFFLKTLTKVRKSDGEVLLCSLNELLLNLMVTTKLNSFFTITATEKLAFEFLEKEKA